MLSLDQSLSNGFDWTNANSHLQSDTNSPSSPYQHNPATNDGERGTPSSSAPAVISIPPEDGREPPASASAPSKPDDGDAPSSPLSELSTAPDDNEDGSSKNEKREAEKREAASASNNGPKPGETSGEVSLTRPEYTNGDSRASSSAPADKSKTDARAKVLVELTSELFRCVSLVCALTSAHKRCRICQECQSKGMAMPAYQPSVTLPLRCFFS